ncbi:MAG: hypothetical protein ACXABC_13335, partial [Candidatus Thorarchaeota archaeon]
IRMDTFPIVTGSDLLGNKIEVPSQLRGSLNVIVVAFQRWHQNLVDSWIPYLKQLNAEIPEVDYYEFPTIRKMNWLSRSIINNGMRAGIPSTDIRGRTITLFIDKEEFNKTLDIADESTIYVFLVNPEGQVFWRGDGGYSTENGKLLREAALRILSESDIRS